MLRIGKWKCVRCYCGRSTQEGDSDSVRAFVKHQLGTSKTVTVGVQTFRGQSIWRKSIPRVRLAIPWHEYFEVTCQVTIIPKNIIILDTDMVVHKYLVPDIVGLRRIEPTAIVFIIELCSSWRDLMLISNSARRLLTEPSPVNTWWTGMAATWRSATGSSEAPSADRATVREKTLSVLSPYSQSPKTIRIETSASRLFCSKGLVLSLRTIVVKTNMNSTARESYRDDFEIMGPTMGVYASTVGVKD